MTAPRARHTGLDHPVFALALAIAPVLAIALATGFVGTRCPSRSSPSTPIDGRYRVVADRSTDGRWVDALVGEMSSKKAVEDETAIPSSEMERGLADIDAVEHRGESARGRYCLLRGARLWRGDEVEGLCPALDRSPGVLVCGRRIRVTDGVAEGPRVAGEGGGLREWRDGCPGIDVCGVFKGLPLKVCRHRHALHGRPLQNALRGRHAEFGLHLRPPLIVRDRRKLLEKRLCLRHDREEE
ncbi:MAG: hypothetical protein BRD41_06300 [Bacteroidetes bacterium QS_1_63_11]|nr:MAG: hypothetical protein BRD41_06300 [Bacteroidetes bacterium QS_1_63_11]